MIQLIFALAQTYGAKVLQLATQVTAGGSLLEKDLENATSADPKPSSASFWLLAEGHKPVVGKSCKYPNIPKLKQRN